MKKKAYIYKVPIIKSVALGFTNSEIAENFGLQKFYVKNQLKKIYFEFEVFNRVQLTLKYLKHL